MLPEDTFQTERMTTANWSNSINDASARKKLSVELETLLTQPVLRHLPEPLQLTDHPDAIDQWISDRAAESAVMTIRDRTSANLLGLLILAEFSEDATRPDIHIGYLFSEHCWGKGYATELVTGLVDWTKGRGHSVRLIGGVETQNMASARVLRKAGFERIAELSCHSNDVFGLVI